MSTPSFAAPDRQPAHSPSVWSAGPDVLSLALMDSRNGILSLWGQIEAALDARGSAGGHAARWLRQAAGRVAWLSEYWIARNPRLGEGAGCPPDAVHLASIDPRADALFDPRQPGEPGGTAQDLPDPPSLRAYLLETLELSLELLERTPPTDEALYFYRAALFHEDWCAEQMIHQAQSLGVALELPLPAGAVAREPLLVPGGRASLGRGGGGFAQDIELPPQVLDVPEFEIDAQPVSWSQFVEFVDDGGYDRAELWQAEGWQWLERLALDEGRRGPRHVEQIGVASGAVMQSLFGRPVRMAGTQSAMHVSWWEADAFARWSGRRLATEVEWSLAAQAAARRGWRWGDVLEWTATTLRPWPGFQPAPWTTGTALDARPAFGQARVLRGASFATPPRLRHPQLRRFARPGEDDAFVGFRTCAI